MSLLRKALLIPPVLAGIAVLYYAIGERKAPERSKIAEAATVVRVVTVNPQAFVPRVIGYGTVEPARTLNAIAQVSGRVSYINPDFKRGDFVSRGDTLIRLLPEDYELAIAEAQTDIASADVDLEELEITLQAQKKTLEIAKSVLDLEKRDLERQKTLLDRNVSTNQSVETQEAAVLQQQTQVQDLENEIALYPVKRKALAQARRKSEVQLETATLNLARTEIRAPFDARVAAVDVEIDEFVAAGQSFGKLDGIDAADINVQISPAQMAGFADLAFADRSGGEKSLSSARRSLESLSATVRVGLGGKTATREARVKRVSDTVDPDTRSVGLIVTVDEPYTDVEPGIRPPLVKGMFAEVLLSAPAVPDRTVLPRNAIVNGRIMTVTQDSRLVLSDVEIVYQFEDLVVLRDPLPAGTRVVVSDVSPVIEGMLLTPVEDEKMDKSLSAMSGPEGGALQ
ncbi:efflux RND transporter periplasmic adaptor subunit [Roseibium aggregatum]|uniref:Biotin/lipoyl-binding protein n=1 Tax=Roseibium aggregatum TaxID=187304 RepID=A0A939IYK8_9HYPH|nr:biotin/lipoyl-binding protein [Roseibium aggregatum]MBN9669086.1 biotin/lipoyl-binding protein [Roseibium aggregatum]